MISITLRMSGVMALGPLEENEATLGAKASFQVSPTRMVATGCLEIDSFSEKFEKTKSMEMES